jgi:hypothetical protein
MSSTTVTGMMPPAVAVQDGLDPGAVRPGIEPQPGHAGREPVGAVAQYMIIWRGHTGQHRPRAGPPSTRYAAYLVGTAGQLVPEGDGVQLEAEGRGDARFCADCDWYGLRLAAPGDGLRCPGLGVGVGVGCA